MKRSILKIAATILLILISFSSLSAGVRSVSFIYKPKFVTADYIKKYVEVNRKSKTFLPYASILCPEKNQDFVNFGFGDYIKRFDPKQKKAINHIIKYVDTPSNGIKLAGFNSVREFQIKHNLTPDNIAGIKTQNRLLEILNKNIPVLNIYASASNELSKFDQTHIKQGCELKREDIPELSKDYILKEFLGVENAGWRWGFDPKTFFFKGAPGIKHIRASSHTRPLAIMIWLAPKLWSGKIINEYTDRIVLPKHLGSNEKYHLFALVDAPSIEKKETVYKKLQTVFLKDRKAALNKITKSLLPSWKKNQQLITDNSIGEFQLGQDVNELIRLYSDKYIIIKGNHSGPVLNIYPNNYKHNRYTDQLIEVNYNDNNFITGLKTRHSYYTLPEGIRVGCCGIDLMSLNNSFSVEAAGQNDNNSIIKIPEYKNMTLQWGNEKKKGFHTKSRLYEIVIREHR